MNPVGVDDDRFSECARLLDDHPRRLEDHVVASEAGSDDDRVHARKPRANSLERRARGARVRVGPAVVQVSGLHEVGVDDEFR